MQETILKIGRQSRSHPVFADEPYCKNLRPKIFHLTNGLNQSVKLKKLL